MKLSRDAAVELLKKHTSQENLYKHAVATEAVMRALAGRMGEEPDHWGIVGLLHDLDYDQTKDSPERHTLVAEPWLREAGLSEEDIRTIQAHNAEALNLERRTPIELALTCAETMTGMVIATALVYPDKRIRSVKPKSVIKRMKESHFARSVNRDHIRLCESLGMSLEEFTVLSIEAMSGVSDVLGL